MLVRDIGTVKTLGIPQQVFKCSTGDVLSGAAINGEVADRRFLGRMYNAASPYLEAWTTVGATSTGERRITLDAKLQHGDSSGGGDMADLSTGMQAAARTFGSDAMTTDYKVWTTGALRLNGPEGMYDLRLAKRYVRPVGVVTKLGPFATSTAAGSIDRIWAKVGLVLESPDEMPPRFDVAEKFSTSTSTA